MNGFCKSRKASEDMGALESWGGLNILLFLLRWKGYNTKCQH
jgi:hypothetical protein